MAYTFDRVTYVTNVAIATDDTFTLPAYPSSHVAADYAQSGETMHIDTLQNDLAQAAGTFTMVYSTRVVTYKDATTIPAGSTITMDLPLATWGTIVALTDSSGGTASDTLAAITGSYVEATIENTVASLAAKINALIARQNSMVTLLGDQNQIP